MTAARELPFLATGGAMADVIARFDWSTTPVGPIAAWPAALRAALTTVLDTPRPVVLAWGPQLTVLHNEAFAALMSASLLGNTAEDALDGIAPALHEALASGKPATVDDRMLIGGRELHLTWSVSPVRAEAGQVVGVLADAEDVTERVVAQRRLRTLQALRSACSAAATPDEAAAAAVGALALDPADIRFALLDRGGPGGEPRVVAPDGPTDGSLPRLDLDAPLEEIAADGSPAVVLPLVADPEQAHGVLVVGVNPHLPLDDDYRGFLDLAASQVAAALAGGTGRAGNVGAAAHRRAGKAELDRIREVTEQAGDLIAIVGADGRCRYVNPAGRRMIGMSPDQPPGQLTLLDVVAPTSRAHYVDAMADADTEGSWTGRIELVDSAGTPIPAWLAIVAHRDAGGGIAFHSAVAHDLRRRAHADDAMYEERERYRSLVAQVAIGLWMTDAEGVTTFVNYHGARLVGRTPNEIVGTPWAEHAHPDDRAEATAGWAAAVAAGEPWQHDHRVLRRVEHGVEVRDVTSSARPLRSTDGTVTGFLGTTVDVTDQRRAELARRQAAAEHAAREASDEAAAQLRAMVEGLAAIVWEAEWREDGIRHTFVSDRAEELLGHPAAELRDEPVLWPRLIHPEDRAEALAYSAKRTAAGVDHDLTYRAVAIDGRVVWLHQVVHVVAGPDGAPLRVQGLAVDVTEQKRAERSTELLDESGRLLADEGRAAAEKLIAIARLAAPELGDAAVVSLVGADGLLRRIAAVHDDPATERRLLLRPPAHMPAELVGALSSGRPVVFAAHESEESDELGIDAGTLIVPLIVSSRVIGVLKFLHFEHTRPPDRADIDLAAELGRRASLMLATERQRDRERQMQQVSAELASAGSVAGAARRLVARLGALLGAGAMSVYLLEPERGLRLVHATGYAQKLLDSYQLIRLDAPVPLAHVARTGEPVWLRDFDDWRDKWPNLLVADARETGRRAAAALPLAAGGRVVGAIGISFPTPRAFPADEREFVVTIVAQAAAAFERAATADERRMIAETLQRSLLPPALPALERLALAARYLPGAHGTRAGGDWYDVLPVDGGVAVAVGDVVGQGAHAAAVMGQLRSALSGYLLEGHQPVEALERLDRFASRVPGAAGSTVACVLLDPATGELTYASAGHLPPLVTGPRGARYLTDARGAVLAVRGRPPYEAGQARIEPGDSLLLYTDGLVERRGEVIDTGLDRLVALATDTHTLAPAALAESLLAGLLDPGPSDDVAVIVARLTPAPLRLTLRAEPAQLRALRAAVADWTSAAGLGDDDTYDLQLALGEAAANAVEHAYRDGPTGTMTVEVARDDNGRVRASVRDEGSWRPEPADPGHRGRGLDMIREVSEDMRMRRGHKGTEVRFEIPPPSPVPPMTEPAALDISSTETTRLRVTVVDAAPRVEVLGDLDIDAVEAVRDELLATTHGAANATVDLSATTYLASAGVALLVEAAAGTAHGRLRVTTSGGVVHRMLALSGVDDVLDMDG